MAPEKTSALVSGEAVMVCLRLWTFLLAVLLFAGEPISAQAEKGSQPLGAKDKLQPQTVTLSNQERSMDDLLKELRLQTGNTVVDRRVKKKEELLKLEIKGQRFWPALEEIARRADCAISLYQPDGQIALVDGPYRARQVCYDGLFRVAVKRLDLRRDEDTASHDCVLRLEVAWEPRFQPLFLEIGPARVAFAPDDKGRQLKADVPGRGQVHVAGRNAVEIDFRLPAPARSSPRMDSFTGSFKVIGPTKMLTFSFDPLKTVDKKMPWRQEQEGVKVSLTHVTTMTNHWALDVLIENPPGGPRFESYQSWLDNNQAYLEGREGNKTPLRLSPFGEEQLEDVTATRAALRYYFKEKEGIRLGQLSNWALRYRTPGRILEVPGTFSLQSMPLP